MIFITIGTQEPFDRLIKVIDELVPSLSDKQVIVQVANSNYKAKNLETFKWLSPKEFLSYFNRADLIISHAGMGTIISALVHEKPIIIVPRLARLREHRNDHQIATAKKFELLNYVHVAYTEQEVRNKIKEVINNNFKSLHKLGMHASEELLSSVKEFISA